MNIDYYLIDCKIKPLNLLKKTLHKIMLRELKAAQKIYTSDQESLKYMNQIGLTNYSLCEPLRLASIISDQENKDLPKVIYDFQQGNKLFIFASTHLKDIELITTEVVDALQGYKIIVVPHEITKKSIDSIQSKWLNSNLLSRLDDNNNSHDVLIIDQVGMLKHLYSVATACYVGGGFSTGIHNILEPALYDIPIIIGPNHSKFLEAQKLINVKKAIEINNSQDLIEAIYLSMESESIPLKFKELFNTNQIYRDIEMIINDIGSNLTSQDSLLRS